MAIGIVSDDEFEAEVNKITPVPSLATIIQKKPLGRGSNDNVPDSLRQIIGETSVIDGRSDALELAKSFGISNSSASAYANGASSTATYNKPSPSITKHINRAKDRITKKASGKLNLVLEAITPELFEDASLRTMTGAARDLAGVIKDMSPSRDESENPNNENGPKYILYAPQMIQENHFEYVTVDE